MSWDPMGVIPPPGIPHYLHQGFRTTSTRDPALPPPGIPHYLHQGSRTTATRDPALPPPGIPRYRHLGSREELHSLNHSAFELTAAFMLATASSHVDKL